MNRKTKIAEFLETGYNIHVTGRHLHVTDAMKDYAIEKVSKIERFSPRIIDVNIIMDIQKLEHRAEIILKVGNIKIRGQAVSEDMYISIDRATTKVEAQLRKYKTKLEDHHQASQHKDIEMNVNIFGVPKEEELAEINSEIEAQNARDLIAHYRVPQMVSRETMPLKILNTEDAVMMLELSGNIFLPYRSAEDKTLKVIYQRNDGTFGIIELETEAALHK